MKTYLLYFCLRCASQTWQPPTFGRELGERVSQGATQIPIQIIELYRDIRTVARIQVLNVEGGVIAASKGILEQHRHISVRAATREPVVGHHLRADVWPPNSHNVPVRFDLDPTDPGRAQS